MFTLLAVIGLGLTLAGTGLAMGAKQRENQQTIKEDELRAQQLREQAGIYEAEQGVIKAQQAEADKDILAAGNIYDINKKALTIQGLDTAYQGAAAKGQIGARAGAGNLAGQSILRQAASVQKKVERQMSLIAGEKTKLGIEYSDTLREFDIKKQELGVTLLTSELKEKWTLENAAFTQEEADWLRENGWQSVLGVFFSGMAGVTSAAGNPNLPVGV